MTGEKTSVADAVIGVAGAGEPPSSGPGSIVAGDWGHHPPDTRERLLLSASDTLARRGIDVPMTDIAAAAGVTRMTLYRQLGTREELLVAVLVHEGWQVGGRLASILDDRTRPFPTRLVDVVAEVVSAVRRSPVLSLFVERVTPTRVEELDRDGVFLAGVWGFLLPYFEDPDVRPQLRSTPERSVDWTLRQVLLQLVVRGRSNQNEDELRDELMTFLVPSVFVPCGAGPGGPGQGTEAGAR